MNTKYLRTKRDRSHIAIQKELRQRGLSVIDLSSVGGGVPDLIVSNSHYTVLIELKEPDGDIYLDQLSFISEWKGFVAFAQTAEQCLWIMMDPQGNGLKPYERKKIDKIVTQYRAKTKDKIPRISVSVFEKLMYG